VLQLIRKTLGTDLVGSEERNGVISKTLELSVKCVKAYDAKREAYSK
jgi:hypothetical protein